MQVRTNRSGGVAWGRQEPEHQPQTPQAIRDRVDHAVSLGFTPRTIEPRWATWSVENAEVIVWLQADGGTHVQAKDAVA